MSRTSASVAFLAVLLASTSAASAADEVDLQVRGNEKVDGTLRPANERETYVVDAPRDASLTVSVKKKGDGAPVPAFDVLDSALTFVTRGAVSGSGAKLNRFVAPKSDAFRFRVAGDDLLDGDYQIKIKMTPKTAWDERDADPLGPGATTDFSFAAPLGSTADLAFLAAAGSPLAPRMVSIDGPAGFHRDFDGTGVTAFRHRVDDLPLGATGEYVLHLRNDAAAEGEWFVAVKLTVPKIAKTNVDIRDTALTGSFSAADRVFGRVVDQTGALLDPVDDGGPLDGVSVRVPADAMTAPTVIALQSSDTFFVDDTNHAAGIAVNLTPAGTVFAVPVTVTVPFDPQAFDDPVNELEIYIQNSETGALEAVPRASLVIDTVANTVSFPTSHFSRFQGVSPRPRPVKGTFAQIELRGAAFQGSGGAVGFGLSVVQGLKGPRTNNGFQRGIDNRGVSYTATTIGHSGPGSAQDFGVLTVVSDEVVSMDSSVSGSTLFVRGRDPDVLIQPPAKQSQIGVSASILLRLAKGVPTRKNLAGSWAATVLEFGLLKDQAGAVRRGIGGRRTRLAFGLDGSVRASKTITQTANAAPDGSWQQTTDRRSPPPGTFTLNKSTVTLDMPLGVFGLSTTVDLIPVVRGDVLVGVADAVVGSDQNADSAMVRLVVLVREGVAATPALLQGRSIFSSIGLLPISPGGNSQDVVFVSDDGIAIHDGVQTVRYAGNRVQSRHDGTGGVVYDSAGYDVSGTYKLAPNGAYAESAQVTAGAVAPRGGFFTTARFGPPFFTIGFGVLAPSKP